LITIKLLGGAKKSLGTDLVLAELDNKTIKNLLEHILSIKPKNTLDLDTKNILVAVNGVDSSALSGQDTVLQPGDTVSIIPIIHGGEQRTQLKIGSTSVELFHVTHKKDKNYEFLDSIRKRFPDLILEGISSRCIVSPTHAKKIIALSLYAQKHGLLLSKKLQTDMLLRFAATTQINFAIKTVGISRADDFTVVAIGKKSSLRHLHEYLMPYRKNLNYAKNSKHLQRLFRISKRHIGAASSKTPLEDMLVERAAILIK
jgi:molybdopterin converting factor small subunit/tRNA threonylcarbamoyladenosine modification (KEOPS) complex Cgi121 subunit